MNDDDKMKLALQKKNIALVNENQELKETNHNLRFENLRMRLEIEELTKRPESIAAIKIMSRYIKKRAMRNEAHLSMLN